jgi:hypothetical protein
MLHYVNTVNRVGLKVEQGMLQGSVLGALLFLLYVNDLIENVQGAMRVLFADDTSLLITRKDEFDLQHKIINIMRELAGLEIREYGHRDLSR